MEQKIKWRVQESILTKASSSHSVETFTVNIKNGTFSKTFKLRENHVFLVKLIYPSSKNY